MTEKRTKSVVLGEILELEEIRNNEEYSELINRLKEQAERKNSTKGETATQKENAKIKEIIKETLAEMGTKARISEIQDANEVLANLKNQKISALLRQLKEEGAIVRTVEKKVAYFEIAR